MQCKRYGKERSTDISRAKVNAINCFVMNKFTLDEEEPLLSIRVTRGPSHKVTVKHWPQFTPEKSTFVDEY